MKKLFLIAAAFAALTVAVPANAQVNIRAGENGIGVRVGPGHDRVHASRQLAPVAGPRLPRGEDPHRDSGRPRDREDPPRLPLTLA
jgi:hypothetical protein